MLFLTDLFTNLPEPILASVVLVAVRGLFKVSALQRLYQLRRAEFWTATAALAGVLVLGILDGVIIGALLSLLLVIARASQPRISLLGRVPGQAQFTDLRENPDNLTIPGLLVIRVDEGIFYANAESIRRQVVNQVRDADTPVRTVVLDVEMTSDLDLSGAEMLDELHSDLQDMGVHLRLARLLPSAHLLLAHAGIVERIGDENIHPRTLFAVASYLTEEGMAHQATCDILPDLIRCVMDLAAARCERLEGEDRQAMDTVCHQLDDILRDLERIPCEIPPELLQRR